MASRLAALPAATLDFLQKSQAALPLVLGRSGPLPASLRSCSDHSLRCKMGLAAAPRVDVLAMHECKGCRGVLSIKCGIRRPVGTKFFKAHPYPPVSIEVESHFPIPSIEVESHRRQLKADWSQLHAVWSRLHSAVLHASRGSCAGWGLFPSLCLRYYAAFWRRVLMTCSCSDHSIRCKMGLAAAPKVDVLLLAFAITVGW
eukprot:1957038-Amphidinium_carterae.3